MKKTIDIMIDIETLGTRTCCPVISIGAAAFDLNSILSTFYTALNVSEQIDSKIRQVDAGTIKWWMSQSNAAKTVFKEDAVATKLGLQKLTDYINSFGKDADIYVWGNGATFDISILESLYYDYNLPVPWKYSKVMDQRTVKRFLGKEIKVLRKGTYHNAVDDAVTQAEYVQACLRGLYRV